MKKKLVAIIFGGRGQERAISRASAMSLLSSIDRDKYIPYPVMIDRWGIWRERGTRGRVLYPARLVGGGCLVIGESRIYPDVAFPILHGDFGEDGTVQGALECASIPYVGCKVTAGAVAADKILTKELASSLGIPTARAVHITTHTPIAEARLRAEREIGYPMFIKPAGLGSSVGCSLVSSPEDFEAAYLGAALLGERILIEEYLEGVRELECAYLNSPTHGEIFTHPGEVSLRGVYTYSEKYDKHSRAVIHPRADVSASVSERIRELSERLVRALGVRQLARIDFFLHEGDVILNEINTMPGFTSGSMYPAMLAEYGISERELIGELIEGASC